MRRSLRWKIRDPSKGQILGILEVQAVGVNSLLVLELLSSSASQTCQVTLSAGPQRGQM